MISLFLPRNLLPAAAMLAATFFLVDAASHDAVPAAPIVVRAAGFDVSQAEARACEAAGDRSRAQCVNEAAGKSLIRSADSIAQLGATSALSPDDELALAAPSHPPRSSAR